MQFTELGLQADILRAVDSGLVEHGDRRRHFVERQRRARRGDDDAVAVGGNRMRGRCVLGGCWGGGCNGGQADRTSENRFEHNITHRQCRPRARNRCGCPPGTHDIEPACERGQLVVMRVHPRSPGTPCPVERRRRRAGLLACGSAPVGRLLRTEIPMASGRWLAAYSCRGSRGFPVPYYPRRRGTSRCAAVSRILRLRSIAPPPQPHLD